jgi:hypothetical protein
VSGGRDVSGLQRLRPADDHTDDVGRDPRGRIRRAM